MKPTDIKDPEFFHRVIDCQFACPAHTRVPEYIRLISEKKFDDAYRINWESNVFPGILGRICDRPCEPACRRGRVEAEPVAICRLKRLCADNKETLPAAMAPKAGTPNGKRVALIGGGPASLTVARDLLPLGYQVDLYDDQASAGGFVRSQVPSFRLPEKVLNQEVNAVLDMGVTTHLNTYISSLKDFLKKGHDAVFIGTGAPRGRDLDLPGRQEGQAFIHVGIEWLAAVQYYHVKKSGPTTLVIGGGNTAMDCCRTARRLGGENVKVIIRGSRDQMKASPWEVEDAVREDIPILEHLSPTAFVVEGGKLTAMRFENLAQGAGKEEVVIPCDEVLLAVGQQNAFPWIEEDIGIQFDDRGRPNVDRVTFQSGLDHVFFGGDAAFGPANVITAVAHGHEAALSIDLFLEGKDPAKDRPGPATELVGQKMGLREWVYDSQVSDARRQEVPMQPTVKSIKDRLLEVELGFDREIGHTEAHRCLNCDVQTVFTVEECIECDACVDVCPTTCINFLEDGDEEDLRSRLVIPADNKTQPLYVSAPLPTGRIMVKDENVCLHCGLCAERCPTSAWDMKKYTYITAKAGQK